jgi:hypothetical protein
LVGVLALFRNPQQLDGVIWALLKSGFLRRAVAEIVNVSRDIIRRNESDQGAKEITLMAARPPGHRFAELIAPED